MADPQEIKNLLRATLVSDPGPRVTLFHLCKLFREQEGYEIPFRQLGFATLDQYLRTIPDVLQVLGSGANAEVRLVSSSKSQHVVDMISKQKKPSKKNKRLPMPIYRPNYMRPNVIPLTNMPFYVQVPYPYRPAPHFQNYRPQYPPHGRPQYSSGARPQQSSYSKQPPPPTTRVTNVNSPAPKPATSPPSLMSLSVTPPPQKVGESKKKKEIPPRFRKSPPAQTVSEPTKHYNGTEMNINGNADVQTKATTSTPINSNRSHSILPSHEYRDNTPTQQDEDIDEECFLSDAEMEINFKVPQVVQVNLMQLIRDYPDGIWCRNLPNLYRKNFNSDLNFLEYGFKSLIHMCSELDYIFKYKQAQSGDFKLFHKDCEISKDAFLLLEHLDMTKKLEDNHPPSNLPPFPEDALSILGEEFDSFPPNVMRYQDFVPVQEVVDAAGDGFIEIRIAEIYDPSKFWFNLNIYNDKLDDIMNDLQDFYNDCDQYLVPSTVLQVGFYCAAKWRNEYHRAKVVNMLPDVKHKVKLFFIDYGTVSAMPIEGICYLHNRFKDFPAQAIRGRLAKIYPIEKDSQWTREVSGRFLQIVKEKVLVAMVDTVQDGVYDLVVADTTGEEDIYINDTLVYENYAVFSHQVTLETATGNKGDSPVGSDGTISEYEESWADETIYSICSSRNSSLSFDDSTTCNGSVIEMEQSSSSTLSVKENTSGSSSTLYASVNSFKSPSSQQLKHLSDEEKVKVLRSIFRGESCNVENGQLNNGNIVSCNFEQLNSNSDNLLNSCKSNEEQVDILRRIYKSNKVAGESSLEKPAESKRLSIREKIAQLRLSN